MKVKKSLIVLAVSAVLMSVAAVSAAEFTSEDKDTIMQNAEASEMPDGELLFDDGAAYLAAESSDPTFEDTVSEQTASAEDVPLDEEHFPDVEFREFLSDSKRDKNQNGILESSEITEIKSIQPEDYSDYVDYGDGTGFSQKYTKSSMQGVEYLTALEKLDLRMTGETGPFESADDLIIDLSTLPLLKELSVSVSSYLEPGASSTKSTPTVLNVSANTCLTTLRVRCDIREIILPAECNIKEYHVSCWNIAETSGYHNHQNNDQYLIQLITQMPRLEKIDIYNISKIMLNTKENPHLRSVNIDSEAYSDVWLDFSNNRALENLYLHEVRRLMQGDKQTYKLDLSNCTSLRVIDITLHGFRMYDFGDCHPETVNAKHYEYVKNTAGGYVDLVSFPEWDSSRIASVSKEFVIKDNRLYPTILDNTPEQDLDSVWTEGHVQYYLNDDRTVTADMEIYIGNIYSPDMVTGLKVPKITETSFTCQWNPVKRPHNGYTVYVQDTLTGKTVKRVSVEKNVTSKTITGLKAGQRYRVIVRAYRTYENKNYYSPYYKGTVIRYTLPKTPSPKAVLRSGRKIQLTWEKTPAGFRKGNSQYVIYYREANSKRFSKLASLPDTAQSYTTNALKKNTTYYFRMRSVISDKNGKYKSYGTLSNDIKVTVK